jgi:hypothetical protein
MTSFLGGAARQSFAAVASVRVNRDEQVRAGAVGNRCAVFQRHVPVVLARVDHFGIRNVFFESVLASSNPVSNPRSSALISLSSELLSHPWRYAITSSKYYEALLTLAGCQLAFVDGGPTFTCP